MTRRNRLFAFAMLFAMTLAGCASSRASGSRSSRGTTLTHEQLASANSDNLYDAIIKLRPEWLTSRGPTSVTDLTPTGVDIYMSGSLLGRAEALKDMRLGDVSEVRYYDAGAASARFGMGHPRGVIEVTRR